jgi:hypothetical protein
MTPTSKSAGILLIGIGVVVIVIGLLVWSGALSWFGRLPGDIRYESENTRVYFPLMSMLLISIVLSVLVALLRRVF